VLHPTGAECLSGKTSRSRNVYSLSTHAAKTFPRANRHYKPSTTRIPPHALLCASVFSITNNDTIEAKGVMTRSFNDCKANQCVKCPLQPC
jgi:hypothetical protein